MLFEECKKATYPQVVEKGNRDLGDMLHSMLLERDNEDCDLLFPQIMQTVKAFTNKQTSERANFLILGHKFWLPEHLLYGPAAGKAIPRKSYAVKPATRMERAHEKLKTNHL